MIWAISHCCIPFIFSSPRVSAASLTKKVYKCTSARAVSQLQSAVSKRFARRHVHLGKGGGGASGSSSWPFPRGAAARVQTGGGRAASAVWHGALPCCFCSRGQLVFLHGLHAGHFEPPQRVHHHALHPLGGGLHWLHARWVRLSQPWLPLCRNCACQFCGRFCMPLLHSPFLMLAIKP